MQRTSSIQPVGAGRQWQLARASPTRSQTPSGISGSLPSVNTSASPDKYYEFGGLWIRETADGADIVKFAFTTDPRIDRNAQLDHSTRIFPNGSWQNTWRSADGGVIVDSIES